jgi:hypothetical protein
MRKLFKERKLFKGGNYMRKYGISKETCEIQDIVISELVVGYPDKLDT